MRALSALLTVTMLLLACTTVVRGAEPPSAPTADGPSPPSSFVDRSGLNEMVFWQAVNGLFAGATLGSAVTAGVVNKHCIDEETASLRLEEVLRAA